MKKVAYVGFGDLGNQISAFLHEAYGELEEIFFDDFFKHKNSFPFNHYPDQKFSDYSFFICLGYHHLYKKNEILNELLFKRRKLPSFFHQSSYIHPDSKIGSACYIYPGCVIDKNVVLKDGVLLNNRVTISHDSVVGDGSFLSPSVTLSGKVKIGRSVFLGTGCLVSNNVIIGEGSMIGIGSVVSKDLPPFSNAVGNPLKVLDKTLNVL